MWEIISLLLYKLSINPPENNSISKVFTFVIFYIPYAYLQYDHILFLEPFYLWVEARRKGRGLYTHLCLFARQGRKADPSNGEHTFSEAL